MDKPTRNLIQSATQAARRLLEAEFGPRLEGDYDILTDGTVLPEPGPHLDQRDRLIRARIVAAIEHQRTAGLSPKEARDAVLREAAFTTLNRFAALKMLEARGVVQECISKGDQSAGFREFGGLAEGLIALPDRGYQLYIEALFDEIGREVRVLFDRRDVAGMLWPRRPALNELLSTLNNPALATVWGEDETIGWIYQYFNGEDERRKMRDESQAPRNSRELAVRNQFFTPRYVVAFLSDNTLGRTWYEMRQGRTRLAEQCSYLVRRPSEVFLGQGEVRHRETEALEREQSKEDLLHAPVYIPHRPLKDPRDIQILDPASGSGHFLLYCFDLLLTIYEEAWDDCPELLHNLRAAIATKADFMRQVPAMILRHNLNGIDIDPRAAQIAELALWMRAQRAYAALGLRGTERPPIRKTNIVVAEPMPGDRALLAEFLKTVDKRLRPLVAAIWEQLRLAGEAGSLLKIEQTIKSALDEARTESMVDVPPHQVTLFGPNQTPMQEVFTFASAEERAFWAQAEEQLLAALERYAHQTGGAAGMRRRLFAENAAQGFAFVDLCRQYYDVVLMNPPFGAASKLWKSELERAYPRSKNDLYAAFVERGLSVLNPGGLLGAITSRTGFFLTSFQKWREEILLPEAPPMVFADLGAGVLDSAMVETAAYCLQAAARNQTTFLRLMHHNNKAVALAESIDALNAGTSYSDVYETDPASFAQVPGSPFAYWAGSRLLELFSSLPPFEREGRTVLGGLKTLSDERFIRAWWEVPALTLGRTGWVSLAKGGSYSPFYAELPLVVQWKSEGKDISWYGYQRRPREGFGGASRGIEAYYRPGLTWPRRTQGGFSVRILPSDCIFGDKGPSAFVCGDESVALGNYLGLINSQPFSLFVSLQMAFGSYEVGVIQRTPVPELRNSDGIRLGNLALACVNLKRDVDRANETSHIFHLPAVLQTPRETLVVRIASWQTHITDTETQLAIHQREIDDIAFTLYGIEGQDRAAIEASLSVPESESQDPGTEDGESDNGDDQAELATQSSDLVADLISYAVGAALGRWDLRWATGERPRPELPDPFAPLPAYSPGMLQLGIEPLLPPAEILVDDPGHPDDIIARIREVLAMIWGERADAIYQEAVEILVGGSDLRPWFRATFFDAHIKRYSKSRRKAPIYWCLSTPSRSYAVWPYYHRFGKDTLYKVLNDYVGPKLDHEQRRLAALRDAGGTSPGAAERKAIESQEQFVAELQTFRDELARVAPLWNPNLNDGVIINYAPLWRLAPWPRAWQKECQQTWEALRRGDYDWSHLAMHLWPERVVPKCAADRSMAIAHGLDKTFWQEDTGEKARPRAVAPAEIQALITQRSSPAVKTALAALSEAPISAEKPKKRAAERSEPAGKRGRKAQTDAVQIGMDLGEE